MQQTWKPMVAGILNIIAGALSLIGFFGVVIAIVAVGSGPFIWGSFPGFGPLTVGFVQAILAIVAVLLIVMGVLPLLGGIYAVQRKKWGLALAGAIVAIIGSALFGIASTVLLALSRDEFE